jgi:hypothetical protein
MMDFLRTKIPSPRGSNGSKLRADQIVMERDPVEVKGTCDGTDSWVRLYVAPQNKNRSRCGIFSNWPRRIGSVGRRGPQGVSGAWYVLRHERVGQRREVGSTGEKGRQRSLLE